MPTKRTDTRARAMRASILAGGRHVFLAEGYERTNMDAVAAAIGVSKMTVYRHYRTKKALFTDIVAEMCDQAIANPNLALVMSRLPLREALETFGRLSLETIFAPETLNLHRLIIAECRRFPELGRLFYDRGPVAGVATLTAYLARKTKKGLRSAEAENLAFSFMALLRGYEHMRALLGLEEPPPRQQRERQVARAVEYLLEKLKERT